MGRAAIMRRILFLVLLLANVLVFIWDKWLGPPAQISQQSTLPPHVQPLKLLAELTPAERQALAKSAEAAPAPIAPVRTPNPTVTAAASPEICVSYGPFPSIEALQTGATRLRKPGISVTERLVPGKVRLGYWVYLPPFVSQHQAEEAAGLLRRRGVKDLYVVTDAANRNAISLGVFTVRSGALDRLRKIRRLGYHALLAERFRDAPRYWLDVRGAESALPAASMFSGLGEGDVRIGRTAAHCGVALPAAPDPGTGP